MKSEMLVKTRRCRPERATRARGMVSMISLSCVRCAEGCLGTLRSSVGSRLYPDTVPFESRSGSRETEPRYTHRNVEHVFDPMVTDEIECGKNRHGIKIRGGSCLWFPGLSSSMGCRYSQIGRLTIREHRPA